ncbi:TPA: type III secretion system needle tip protein SctA [Providencia rettgeri]
MFSISNTSAPRISQLNPTEQPQKNVVTEATIESGDGKKEGINQGQHLSALQYADSKAKQLSSLNGEQVTPESASEQINERILTRQQFDAALKSLGNSGVELTEEQKKQLQQEVDESLSKLPVLSGGADTTSTKKMMSDAELWTKISESIGSINNSYLKMYESVVAGYTAFYQALSDKVLAQMGSWVQPGTDGNSVTLYTGNIAPVLAGIYNAYEKLEPSSILLPPQDGQNKTFTSHAEAKIWASELGLPESCIKGKNGGYVIIPDMTPLKVMEQEIYDSFGTSSPVKVDNAKYQAWQAGFKSQEENLKTTLQTLTQKYSNANSIYDNLVKVLSSTISSCLETAKSFLQG